MPDRKRVACGCGQSWSRETGMGASWRAGSFLLIARGETGYGYCPGCGARLSFDADGKPVATPMVAMAALKKEIHSGLKSVMQQAAKRRAGCRPGLLFAFHNGEIGGIKQSRRIVRDAFEDAAQEVPNADEAPGAVANGETGNE